MDEKTDESILAEKSELFSSALYIIIIPVVNNVHPVTITHQKLKFIK